MDDPTRSDCPRPGRVVADAEVRANGGEIIHRGPLRLDDPHWPAEAARLHRGLRIRDVADPDPKGWVALVFPDGSVRLCPALARELWFGCPADPCPADPLTAG